MPEEDLLMRARKGDLEAKSELVGLYAGDLRRFVDRRTGARIHRIVSGSDLCQETFAQVFRSLDTLPETASMDTFRARLFQNAEWIIRGKALSAGRYAGESVLGSGEFADGRAAPGGSGPGQVTGADEQRWLLERVARLDPKYGEVIHRRLQGQEFEQIARDLGEQTEAVRKRYYRAYAELKRSVRRQFEDESTG